MKLAKSDIGSLRKGQVLTIHCDTAAELNSVSQTAYVARREMALNNEIVNVACSAKTMTVTITRQ